MDSLPSPPHEDSIKFGTSKKHAPKPVKMLHKSHKRPAHAHANTHPPSPTTDGAAEARHKRVWKACERCRMKKTKCDGEFPCKRCKDDGLVCTAGTRKKTEYKQLPRGYAEVLENTQFALITTVHKLYAMVRNRQAWDLGEPELNDRGQPVIHDIASKLGCIRPSSDADLPVHSVFPEDEAGLVNLALELEKNQQREQQQQQQQQQHQHPQQQQLSPHQPLPAGQQCAPSLDTDDASSPELDHSDFELDYRRVAYGGSRDSASSAVTTSPQSLAFGDFDVCPPSATTTASRSPPPQSTTAFPVHHHHAAGNTTFPTWTGGDFGGAWGGPYDVDMLNRGLIESSFGTIKPHVLSLPHSEVMMGMGDPMMYSGGYDMEELRL